MASFNTEAEFKFSFSVEFVCRIILGKSGVLELLGTLTLWLDLCGWGLAWHLPTSPMFRPAELTRNS